MKKLTIFTPTYNRAYCLHQCYDSLCSQTNQNFIWLIIDDGSTDNTNTVVESWIKENKIDIQYHYQDNQGMHGGHNTAYKIINTELNTCIDSDDFMPKTAVQDILNCWESIKDKSGISGIIGLDANKDGEIIGDKIPDLLDKITLEDLHYKYKISGDKKLVLRTDIVKKYTPQYPLFKNERFVPLGILYLLMDKEYQLKCLNKTLCIVEYMDDGSSKNIIKQYRRHPRGFQHARLITMKYSKYPKIQFKNAIHLISHSLQLKDYKVIKKTPKLWLTLFAIPFGIILYLYVLRINTVKA